MGTHHRKREPSRGATSRIVLLAAIATMAAAVPGAAAPADEAPGLLAPEPQASFQAVADATAKIFLNDLSSRRRSTRLFPNPQHPRDGVQENFVNTTRGNLTFLVRDLVAVAPMPLVVGRVYDSAYQEADGDFGPGWKLTVDEKLEAAGGELRLTDAANVAYRFKLAGAKLVPLTPGFQATGTVEGDGSITLRTAGIVRRFASDLDGYRLVEVASSTGRATLSYRNGRIAAIASGTAEVRLRRRADGRIVAVRDHLGRTVRYGYDRQGALATVAPTAPPRRCCGTASR